MFNREAKTVLPENQTALPGREHAIEPDEQHLVLGVSLLPPFPAASKSIVFGMGCFWGAEKRFWVLDGVLNTHVGYAGGITQNPTYHDVCSGQTGHTEVVRVVYDPAQIALDELLAVFWQEHNPTQGMRQGNDRGTQYRSAIFATDEQSLELIRQSKDQYAQALAAAHAGEITTEIGLLDQFFYAEAYHQQYLARNPNGYCGLRGTGVSYGD